MLIPRPQVQSLSSWTFLWMKPLVTRTYEPQLFVAEWTDSLFASLCRMDRGLYVLSRHYHCFGLALKLFSASSSLVSLKPHSCEHVEEVTSYVQLYMSMFQLVLFSCRVLHGSSRRWRDVGSVVLRTWNCVFALVSRFQKLIEQIPNYWDGQRPQLMVLVASKLNYERMYLRLTCYTLYVVHILYIEIHRDILHLIHILHFTRIESDAAVRWPLQSAESLPKTLASNMSACYCWSSTRNSRY